MQPLTAYADPFEHLEIGYWFEPYNDPHLPGHPKMLVILCAQPTHQHYDPESIEVPSVKDSHLTIHRIHHLAPQHETVRVCAGTIIIRDRVNKEVEVFSLGGEMTVNSQLDLTACTYTSPAPIFDLLSDYSLDTLLAEEIEILLAQRRAAWAGHPAQFEARLARAEPRSLYIACLKVLHERYAQCSVPIDDPDYHLIHFLRSQACVGPEGLISSAAINLSLADLL